MLCHMWQQGRHLALNVAAGFPPLCDDSVHARVDGFPGRRGAADWRTVTPAVSGVCMLTRGR